MQSHSITLADVTVSHGVAEVFRGVSLTVGAGSRIGVVGPNGVGQTTLEFKISLLRPITPG